MPEDYDDRPPRVLCFDSGGFRGVVSIAILRALERALGRPAHEVFDLIVGTSAGGVIAFNAALRHLDADGIEQAFVQYGRRVFEPRGTARLYHLMTRGSLLGSDAADKVLQDMFGEDLVLSSHDAGPHTACIAVDCSVSPGRPAVFSSYPRKGFAIHGTNEVAVWKAVRASCSVPFVFGVFEIDDLQLEDPPNLPQSSFRHAPDHVGPVPFMDGGLIAADPSPFAFVEARALFGHEQRPVVVSIGTGQSRDAVPEGLTKGHFSTVAYTALQIATGGNEVVPIMAEILGDRYFRIDGPLDEPSAFDPASIAALQESGRRIAEDYPCWDALVEACGGKT